MPPQIQNINLNDEQLLIKLFTGLFFLVLGIIAMFRYDQLFRKWIKNEWWRKNLAVILVSELFFFAVAPIYPDVQRMITFFGLVFTLISYPVVFAIMVFLTYNLFGKIYSIKYFHGNTFAAKQLWMTVSIIIAGCLVILPINYVSNGFTLKYYALSCMWAAFFGGLVSIFNIVRNYIELERKQKLSEKELELSKLRELKTQAELDALHSKINPHFLYNALNSIADLSITDGKKARKMTTALADLFRYSINYSNHNYASLKDEMEMAETYLQIEKIRFEDKLAYTVNIDDTVKHYLVPRFLLQPLAENAVKHGLKSTGTATSVELHAGLNENSLLIEVKDNGPGFPADINPGYGIKSVYDKLDLLFPGNYEIKFRNEPEKKIIIHITKMMKDEPIV